MREGKPAGILSGTPAPPPQRKRGWAAGGQSSSWKPGLSIMRLQSGEMGLAGALGCFLPGWLRLPDSGVTLPWKLAYHASLLASLFSATL